VLLSPKEKGESEPKPPVEKPVGVKEPERVDIAEEVFGSSVTPIMSSTEAEKLADEADKAIDSGKTEKTEESKTEPLINAQGEQAPFV
jgi:diphthamide biosynthesis methyltransferase